MNQLAPIMNEQEIGLITNLSKQLHASKALPAQLDSPEKVFVVLLAWRDLGLNPTQALNWLYLVNWKVSIYWETAALLMKRAWYHIKWEEVTSKVAKVTIWHKDSPEEKHTETYTMEMAVHAWIAKSATWQKYPQVMLRRKALAFARKLFAPECLWGYSIKEEMDGEVINENEPVAPIEELTWDFESIPQEEVIQIPEGSTIAQEPQTLVEPWLSPETTLDTNEENNG